MFPRYPYLNYNDYNLDWIIRMVKKLDREMDDFTALTKITWAGAWDITKYYTQWSLVDDNGNGYISIQPVPRNVPITDTNYWVLVADYSALYAAFSQRITNLENAVDNIDNTEIPGLQNQIDIINNTGLPALQNQIDNTNINLNNTNINLNNLKKRADLSNLNILFIMDSYGGHNTSSNDNVADAFSNLTGATCYLTYLPGAALPQFKTLAENWTGEHDTIDTIVLIGGANDQAETQSNITANMQSFINACKSSYDNLKNIYVLCAGLTFSTAQYPQFTIESRETLWNGYRNGCRLAGAIYIDNSQYILRNTQLLTSDYCHPSALGVDKIVDYAIDGVIHGVIDVHYIIDVTMNSVPYRMCRDNGMVSITVGGGQASMFYTPTLSDATGNVITNYGTFSDSLIDNKASSDGLSEIGAIGVYADNSNVIYFASMSAHITEKEVKGYVMRYSSSSPISGINAKIGLTTISIHN